MAIKINRPNQEAPITHESVEKGDWLIHVGASGGGLIQFNKGGWQEIPDDLIIAVYDTSIDVDKTTNMVIMSLNNAPNISMY